jgi:hypothetical protein
MSWAAGTHVMLCTTGLFGAATQFPSLISSSRLLTPIESIRTAFNLLNASLLELSSFLRRADFRIWSERRHLQSSTKKLNNYRVIGFPDYRW